MALTAAQQTLVDWVESRMDEITPTGQTPTVPHNVIFNELEESARVVLQRGRTELVMDAATDGTSSANSNAVQQTSSTLIPVPTDLIRFIRVKLKSWRKPVDQLQRADTNKYRQMFNEFQSGQSGDPAAFLVPYLAGSFKRGVECFPKDDQSNPVGSFYYIPLTAPEDVPSDLQDAMVWDAAGRCFQSIKDEWAQAAFQHRDNALHAVQVGILGELAPGAGGE